ncbi:MAG: nitroreductase family protein [Acidimicrobiales bacterium]
MTTINDMSVRDAIYGLRATRIFDGRPIPPEHLDQILEATTMACSSGNTQPWELVVVTDLDLKLKIKAEMEIGFAPVDADRVQPEKDLVDGVGRPITGHAAIENLEKAAAIVVVCWNPDRGIRFTGEYEELPDGSLKETREIPGGRGASLFPACQNMMLAARSFGVQSLFTTFFYLRYQQIKDILGIPPRIFMENAIFLGYADEKLGDPKRRPLSEIAHINGWDNAYEVAE